MPSATDRRKPETMAINLNQTLCSTKISRTFPLGTLPPHAICAQSFGVNPDDEAFAAVGRYWHAETNFGKTLIDWARTHGFRLPKAFSVYSESAMSLAARTDTQLWLAQTNEENKGHPAVWAYSRDTPVRSNMPELAKRGMTRLLRQMLTRAGIHGELPAIPMPTLDDLKPHISEYTDHSPALTELFTLPHSQLLDWLTAVDENDYEEDLEEWVSVNALIDGCPSKAQIRPLLQAITDLNDHTGIEDWWTTNSGYRLLSLIFHITTDSDNPVHAQWCETYVPVGDWGDDYIIAHVWKPAPVLELTVPSWDDYNVETWQQYLVDALHEAATTLNLPAPPPVSWTTHAPTPAQRRKKPTSKSTASPQDLELFEIEQNRDRPYTLRTNADSTTVFTKVSDTLFAVDIPTPIAAQHPGEPLGDYYSLCDTTSAFGDIDSETVFQFVVVPEDEADAQGTGDGTVVADWWEDDGFYVEDTPETDEFLMRHVNDEDDDGNPTEVRALRRMVSADGYVFVTMWTYPYNTVASQQQAYVDSLTTMRIITA